MSSIVDQLTTLYVFVDDTLLTCTALTRWRQSPHAAPAFAYAEVLTLALLQGCLGVASLKQTYRLVDQNYRSAFPRLCSYRQWIARLHALPVHLSTLLRATTQIAANAPAFYLIDAKPLPVCHRLRHGRVRLLREDGAYWGKTSKGWFFGFKLHLLRHIDGRIVNLVLTPGNWDDRAPVLTLLEGVDGGVTLGDLGYDTGGCAREKVLAGTSAAGHRDNFVATLVPVSGSGVFPFLARTLEHRATQGHLLQPSPCRSPLCLINSGLELS